MGEVNMQLNNNSNNNESNDSRKSKNALIFDFDGTLIDSQSVILDSIENVFSKFLNRVVSKKEVQLNYHPDWKMIVQNFEVDLKSNNISKLKEMWIEASIKNVAKIKPFEDSYRLLSVLDKNYDLYLWTGRDRQSTQYLLNLWHLDKYFVNISCGDDLIGTKPSKDSFNELVKKTYSKKMMIGDSLLDYKGALTIGMPMLAVSWCSLFESKLLKADGVEHFAKNCHDALSKINHLMAPNTQLSKRELSL